MPAAQYAKTKNLVTGSHTGGGSRPNLICTLPRIGLSGTYAIRKHGELRCGGRQLEVISGVSMCNQISWVFIGQIFRRRWLLT